MDSAKGMAPAEKAVHHKMEEYRRAGRGGAGRA